MNNEQITQAIIQLSQEIEKLKTLLEFPQEIIGDIKGKIFSTASTPTGYLQTLNLTGNAQSIQVPANPDQWVELNTNIGIIRIGGYKS